jgi:hypothetical protein
MGRAEIVFTFHGAAGASTRRLQKSTNFGLCPTHQDAKKGRMVEWEVSNQMTNYAVH